MTISYNWLKTYLPELNLDAEETAKLLTDIGLEVEAIEDFETVKGGLQGLVIGYVLEKEKHPDADRLSVTKVQVDEAGTVQQIVCGAPNVDKGQKVVVALPGTTVNPSEGEPFKIKLSKIRGVESAGMICAEDEIGLGKSHEGIMILPEDAPIGQEARTYFNVSSDKVIHIGLTPNRIDAASHLGVARDLKAALHQRRQQAEKLALPEVKLPAQTANGGFSVSVDPATGCKKYLVYEIHNITVGESPAWLKQRLGSIGVRTINNIVDITNYVMHECGQPLHAFDAGKIAGKKVLVRQAKPDEVFVTLDGVERKLTEADTVIADAEKPMCLAGIFGGAHSGVTGQTTSVLLESAWFNPVHVRKSARRYELHTDSSFRFERGADPQMTLWALARAAQLIQELAGGQPADGYMAQEHGEFTPAVIVLDTAKMDAFTGQHIAHDELNNILLDLDFNITAKNGNAWTLEAPLYRVDVTRPVDVYEEVLRIYGYNNIAIPAKLNATPQLGQLPDREKLVESISQFFSDKGLAEIMNNSLTAARFNELAATEEIQDVNLLNPLSSELGVMRNALLYGGLQNIAYNLNRQNNHLKFFELGTVYHKSGGRYAEDQQLGIWITGNKFNGNWSEQTDAVSYYTIKGIADALLNKYVKTNTITAYNTANALLYDTFSVTLNNKALLTGGAVKPEVLAKFDISQPVYHVYISLDVLVDAVKRTKFKYREVSRFPAIQRDLSLLLDEKVEFSTLQAAVMQADKTLVKSVNVFDVYTGKNLEPGKRSYAISLTIQDDNKTLKDEEVEKLMAKVMKNITEKTGAVLR